MFENLTLNEKPIKVLQASGYDDGYYWNINAVVEYDESTYHILNAGSCSGYILKTQAVVKGNFERLYGEEQKEINLGCDFGDDARYCEETIVRLFNEFLESGAKEKWECFEDDDWEDTHIKIDGEEIEKEKED